MDTLRIVKLHDKVSLVFPAIGAAVMVGFLEWLLPDRSAAVDAGMGTLGAFTAAKIGSKWGFSLGFWLEKFDNV